MPIRFRKSFKIFPGVKINVSKGSFSVSVGRPGATLNFSRQGVRQTIGVPGSGVSHTSYLFKKDSESDDNERDKDNNEDRDKEKESKRAEEGEEEEEQEVGCFPGGCLLTLVLLAISVYIVAYNLHWIPQTFLTDLLQVIIQWMRDMGM